MFNPNYKITRARRKSISLHILADGTVEVRAPILIPKFIINDFIRRNEKWINKHTEKRNQNKPKRRNYIEGEKFLFLGKEYSLKLQNITKIELKGEDILFPKALEFRVKKEIESWYIKQAKEIITKQVQEQAKEMKASYLSIYFSDTRSKWGSCTHDNRLQFSWRLVMAPLLVVRYVAVHELAHTKEKNHSRRFWSLVYSINPSYKEQIKWLKTNGHTLSM